MANWKSMVDAFFRKAGPDNSFKYLVNAGASADAIHSAETQIGMSLPDELCSFYLNVNGIGLGSAVSQTHPNSYEQLKN